MHASLSDPELVDAARAGSSEAFGEVVRRYQNMVCAIAYACLGDPAASEDVGQQTFVNAWRKLPDLRDPNRLKPWLAQMARGHAIDATRARERRTGLAAAAETVAKIQAKTEPSPEELGSAAEERRLLWKALRAIPPMYSEPLVLYYREESSIRAVAESLNLSEAAAKKRVARGRDMLRDRLLRTLEQELQATRPQAGFALAVLGSIAGSSLAASPATASTVAASPSTKGPSPGGRAPWWTLGTITILGGTVGVAAIALVGLLGGASAGDFTSQEGETSTTEPQTELAPAKPGAPAGATHGATRPLTPCEGAGLCVGTGDITVHLIDTETGQPLSNVYVTLSTSTRDESGLQQEGWQAISDDWGQVFIHDATPQVYALAAKCFAPADEFGKATYVGTHTQVDLSSWTVELSAEPAKVKVPFPTGARRENCVIPERIERTLDAPTDVGSPFKRMLLGPDGEPTVEHSDADGDGELSELEWMLYDAEAAYVLETESAKEGGEEHGWIGGRRIESEGAAPFSVSFLESAPTRGPRDAPVTIIEVVAPACAFCARAHVTLEALRQEYGNRLHVKSLLLRLEHFPLESDLAACAARKLGAFFPYIEAQWSRVTATTGDYSREDLARIASETGLERSEFLQWMDSEQCRDEVAAHASELRSKGIAATPTWIINGRIVQGVRPIQHYRDIIDELL